MGRVLQRLGILLYGEPGCGKTTLERRITDALLSYRSISTMFVLDREAEWSVTPDGVDLREFTLSDQVAACRLDEQRVNAGKVRIWDGPCVSSAAELARVCEMFGEAEGSPGPLLPRRVIWRCGQDPAHYAEALGAAVDEGDVLVVFTEGDQWFPHHGNWPIKEIRPGVDLGGLFSRGRAHILNTSGERTAFHWICDTQYPQQLHWKLASYATSVLAGPMRGQRAMDYLRGSYGKGGDDTKALLEQVRAAKKHEWITLAGERPRLAPYRGGGRR